MSGIITNIPSGGSGPANIVQSASSGNFSTPGPGTYQVISAPAITTTGGKVVLKIVPYDGLTMDVSSPAGNITTDFRRNGTMIAQRQSSLLFAGSLSLMEAVDSPAAGTWTYSLHVAGATGIDFKYVKLVVEELSS